MTMSDSDDRSIFITHARGKERVSSSANSYGRLSIWTSIPPDVPSRCESMNLLQSESFIPAVAVFSQQWLYRKTEVGHTQFGSLDGSMTRASEHNGNPTIEETDQNGSQALSLTLAVCRKWYVNEPSMLPG